MTKRVRLTRRKDGQWQGPNGGSWCHDGLNEWFEVPRKAQAVELLFVHQPMADDGSEAWTYDTDIAYWCRRTAGDNNGWFARVDDRGAWHNLSMPYAPTPEEAPIWCYLALEVVR